MKKVIKKTAAVVISAVCSGALSLMTPDFPEEHICSASSAVVFSASDLVKLKQSIIGNFTFSAEDAEKYDVTGDGKVNIMDFSIVKNSFITNTEIEVPGLNKRPSVMKLDVNMIFQNPELPTGCEATSLAMLLNHYGFNADKQYLAKSLMPKFNFILIEGVLYGADFMTTFPGNPENNSGYGCFTPCMVTTAEKYFGAIGNDEYYLDDISGTDFDTLLSYVAAGKPVMTWATMNMAEVVDGMSWTTPEGKKVTWKGNEHCLVLTGYDSNTGLVYVNDPLKGKTTYTMSVFSLRYNEMGKYAAVLMKKGEKLDINVPEPPHSPIIHHVGDKVTYVGPVYYSSYGGKFENVSGTFTISEIVDDETRAYRIRLGTAGWVPYDFDKK